MSEMAAPVTAAEFEAAYAARSGVSVQWLHHHGRYAERCDCGEVERFQGCLAGSRDGCEGWAMGHQHEDALAEAEEGSRAWARR